MLYYIIFPHFSHGPASLSSHLRSSRSGSPFLPAHPSWSQRSPLSWQFYFNSPLRDNLSHSLQSPFLRCPYLKIVVGATLLAPAYHTTPGHARCEVKSFLEKFRVRHVFISESCPIARSYPMHFENLFPLHLVTSNSLYMTGKSGGGLEERRYPVNLTVVDQEQFI